MSFIHDDFLLHNEPARRLYHEVAAPQPILDYHCHLPVEEIAANRRFENLYDIWLAGDHYKWRAMRANGVPEKLCTGDAEPYDKFLAWARTVPATLRNPLYHWTHLELKRYFDIDVLLNENTARRVWDEANEKLPQLRVQDIFEKMQVRVVCTTDDPTDTLEYHRQIRASGVKSLVFPAVRPEAALRVDDPPAFNAWAAKLGQAAGQQTGTFAGFLDALRARHQFFHEQGCRLSDHGLNFVPAAPCREAEAAAIFAAARNGQAANARESEMFGAFLMRELGRLDAEKGWVKQLHLGALRNNNTRALRTLGRDTGFDSIGDWPQAQKLARYLDDLDSQGRLPKLIVYNLNPADNYAIATMLGNFQDGSVPGKMQFGSGWWFLDQKEAMTWQLNALSNLGLLSRFVGMLTDSRSFLSYPRHEYFRRVLCNLLGQDIANGELPDDHELLAPLVEGICYRNATEYFGFDLT
jgi:glucuronate isomerase